MTAFSHKLIHNSITQSKASRPQMTAKFHTGRLLHRTQYARSRWCVVHFTPLHCNNFELTIHLMIVGLLSTALFQYLKCQDQRVSENGRPTVKALSYSAVHEISEGSLFFTFSLPGGAARTPAAPSVTPLLTRFSKNFIFEGFFLNDSAGHWKCCAGSHAARRPVVGPHWLNQTTLMQSSFYTLRGCYICKFVEIYLRFISDFWVSKCKAVFALASFHDSSALFFKPAWCSNWQLSDSRCQLTGLLLIAWNNFASV